MMIERPDNIALAGVVGSTAYGLAHADSDTDTLGIFIAPLNRVLGLDGPYYASGKAASWVGHEPDETYHEIGKFINLALKSNPTILELLWLDSYTRYSESGALLREYRQHFLSERAVRGAYGEYAVDQAQRLMRRATANNPDPRTHKHARHVYRLLEQGCQLLTTGEMTLNVGYMRDALWEMGDLAQNDPNKFYRNFEQAKQHFDGLDSVLPEKPNREVFEHLLPKIRLAESQRLREIGP